MRVFEGIKLSVDTDFKEKRAAAAGHKFMRMYAFFLWDNSRENGDIFRESVFHDIFIDKSNISVVKQANLYDVLSSCCLSLFVAVNNLEKNLMLLSIQSKSHGEL